MTIHTGAVPRAYRVVFFQLGRDEECLAHWRPDFFGHDVGEWELFEGAALTSFDPQNLERMRSG